MPVFTFTVGNVMPCKSVSVISVERLFFLLIHYQHFRHPPKSHDEWLHLLQQQEALHNMEMQKWQKVLQAALQLLRQVNGF
jgi:hypothetical protein